MAVVVCSMYDQCRPVEESVTSMCERLEKNERETRGPKEWTTEIDRCAKERERQRYGCWNERAVGQSQREAHFFQDRKNSAVGAGAGEDNGGDRGTRRPGGAVARG